MTNTFKNHELSWQMLDSALRFGCSSYLETVLAGAFAEHSSPHHNTMTLSITPPFFYIFIFLYLFYDGNFFVLNKSGIARTL